MKQSSSSSPRSFWQSAFFGTLTGALASVLISGLSAFAMRRLGQDMAWSAVVSGGAAGGLAGHLILRAVQSWLDRTGLARSSTDRFAGMILTGLGSSLILGVALFGLIFSSLPVAADGTRTLGPRLFVMIGWLVGILASSIPLAIVELLQEDSPKN